MISKEISDIQNELLNTEHLIDEQEIKNNEYNSYMDKKNEKRLTNAITLDDFHIYTLSELKREREEMLSMYTKKKFELQDILLQEKKLLKSFKEELASTVDIQLIRQKQEAEIERLEKEIRTTHACQSEQLKRFKEMSKIKQEQLDREIKSILDNVTEEAKKISNRLIIEHVSNICNENEELYKDILSKIDEIKFLEKEKSALQRQNEEIKRKQMYAKDLEYIERSVVKKLTNRLSITEVD
ncbi:unnamed protein product [Heterobilharzia americana]|nr:unnamed protein product [Heterobilharzia americana]